MQTAEIAIALIVAMSAIEQRHLTCAMRCWNRLSPALPPPAEGVRVARHAHTPGDRAEPSSRATGEISPLHSPTADR
jgi:hypothetical protein